MQKAAMIAVLITAILVLITGFVLHSTFTKIPTLNPVPLAEKVKDPVCGMWVVKDETGDIGTVIYDNAQYFFCAKECVATFMKNPEKFVKACCCRNVNRDCKCDHCLGKKTPCDCR